MRVGALWPQAHAILDDFGACSSNIFRFHQANFGGSAEPQLGFSEGLTTGPKALLSDNST